MIRSSVSKTDSLTAQVRIEENSLVLSSSKHLSPQFTFNPLLTEAYCMIQQPARDTGFQGIALPYSPRTDDVIALTLLSCFFLSSLALSKGKRFLSQQVKDFIYHRERASIFDNSTASDVRYLMVLILQTCVLSGIVFFNYFHSSNPALTIHCPSMLLLGIYVGSCLFFFLFKWIIYLFLGWIFFDKNKTEIWLESYTTLIYYAGFFLFPFVLFLVYFGLSQFNLLVFGLGILIFTKILMFYKWVKLFFIKLKLFSYYFCTFAPLK